MAQVNMSLRIDAELKDAFMAAAKSMDRNGSQLIRDFMRQTVERSIIPGSVTRSGQTASVLTICYRCHADRTSIKKAPF